MAKTATATDTALRKRGRPRKDANGAPPKAPKVKATPAGNDKFGFRLGSKKSQAAALYAKGATLSEVKEALKSTQFNVLNELEEMKGVKIAKVKVPGSGARKVTRYTVSGEPK